MPGLIEAALSQWGEAERVGNAANPRMLDYLAAAGIRLPSDVIPWCGCFMTWCAAHAGIVPPPHPAVARSWLTIGQVVTDPKVGDIVVIQRGETWQGHVGLFIRRDGDKVLVLGGNQGDQVCIAGHKASAILGIRRLEVRNGV